MNSNYMIIINWDEPVDYIEEYNIENWKHDYEFVKNNYYDLYNETRFTPRYIIKFFRWWRKS